MRIKDAIYYFRLRRFITNPWEIVRFRKYQRPGQLCELCFMDGRRSFVRGHSQDLSLFNCIFLDDEYLIAAHRQESWECAVDIGGNAGFLSILVADIARKVICYEPIQVNFRQLQENTRNWPNVETICKAVSNESGTVRIFLPEDPRGSARYSQFRDMGDRISNQCTEVPAITLDELFAEHNIGRCDLLKIDVEGAEYQILYATSDDVLSRIQRIYGEYHNVSPHDPRTRIEAFSEYVRSKGFEVELRPQRKKVNQGLFFARKSAPDRLSLGRAYAK